MTPSSPTSAYPTSTGQSPAGGEAGIVEQTQDKIGQVVDQAQQSAGQVTEQVKQQATSQLESQKDRAVDSLVTVAQALRQTGQHLHEQKQDGIAGYVDQAAARVESLTNHVRARDVPQLLDDTEDLARRRPGLFLGAALALGFVGGRFLMSSGQRARMQRGYGLGGQANGGGLRSLQPGSAYMPPRTPSMPPRTPYTPPRSSYAQPGAGYAETTPSAGGIDGAPSSPVV